MHFFYSFFRRIGFTNKNNETLFPFYKLFICYWILHSVKKKEEVFKAIAKSTFSFYEANNVKI